jgi:glycosyltransferase involved in cell wall biosynthesis
LSDPNLLLCAYQCGPGLGSVSQIGWEWYSRLSQRIPLTLVTHTRNREALARNGAPLANSEVRYIDTEWFAGPLYRLASRIFRSSQHSVFLVSSLDFYVYDWQAFRELRRLSALPWNLIHAVTPVSPIAATKLYRLGLPLIVGPWNGGLQSPKMFPEIMRQDAAWLYPLRSIGEWIDALTGCTRNAARILSATRATTESLPQSCRRRVCSLLENGVDLSMFQSADWNPAPSSITPLEVIFVGRLVPFKGVSMLLEALARVRNEIAIRLTVVGDGPLRENLEREAAEREVADLVEFTGNLVLQQVATRMRRAHLFCLPSVRESGGAVLLEAMACALPVTAVDYGGPAEIVDDQVGRLLSAAGREAVVRDLVSVFRDVVRQPETWRLKGLAGRQRAVEQYGWDAKISQALTIYRDVLSEVKRG